MSASEVKDAADIFGHKRYETPSAFTPKSLLREARRQKGARQHRRSGYLHSRSGLRHRAAPARRRTGASLHPGWACYHTELYVFEHDGQEYGIVGCAVGAAFAVLIAEELFASGCRLLHQRDVGRPYYSGASPALFCRYRSRVA